MLLDREKFEDLVIEAINNLPKNYQNKLHNVAILVEDTPSKAQLKKLKVRSEYALFGLFEGYAQSSRLNFGPVLPDRITIFRIPICQYGNSENEIKKQVISTVKHEIAHHFGSGEVGARKAGRKS